MQPIIQTKDLRKVYKMGQEKVVALSRINVSIPQGQICCVLGTSGSGKSTLLNMMAGLEKATHGDIFIGKSNITKMNEKRITKFRQRYIGFVFQSYNLMNDISALDNVAMPLTFRGMSKNQRRKRAAAMLHYVGLGDRLLHKPNQMSGGQQQRVGIARAFVSLPKIVYADEPTGNLDTKTTDLVMKLMINMAKNTNQTLIIVTHNNDIADYCDRIITIVDGLIIDDKINENPKSATENLD